MFMIVAVIVLMLHVCSAEPEKPQPQVCGPTDCRRDSPIDTAETGDTIKVRRKRSVAAAKLGKKGWSSIGEYFEKGAAIFRGFMVLRSLKVGTVLTYASENLEIYSKAGGVERAIADFKSVGPNDVSFKNVGSLHTRKGRVGDLSIELYADPKEAKLIIKKPPGLFRTTVKVTRIEYK